MKKLVSVIAIVLTIVVMATVLVSCSGDDLNFGKELVKTDDMITVLTELTAGTADVGIMDSIMAGYYMSQDTNYANTLMIIENLTLAEEQYGIAARKEAASTTYQINKALVALKNNGKVAEIATKYGLTNDLAIDGTIDVGADTSTDTDWATIKNTNQVIKIGYTVFAPIAYQDADNNFVGFDIDLAKAVGEYLGVSVQFVEINWETKEFELNSGNIDLIWNGLTINDERKAAMSFSIPYLYNKQIAVIRKADKDIYTSTDSMKDATIAVESGSAGQDVVEKAE